MGAKAGQARRLQSPRPGRRGGRVLGRRSGTSRCCGRSATSSPSTPTPSSRRRPHRSWSARWPIPSTAPSSMQPARGWCVATASSSPASVSRCPARNRTRFAAIYSGHPGVDPYTTAVSDMYQDLYGEGSFTGKGIYDVDAFERATHGRFPPNTLLSHDLIEGCFARAGLATDIQVYDDYPSSYLDLDAAQAPVDPRRLAAPPLDAAAPSPAPAARRPTRCRRSRCGRSSTTCAAAWSRSPSWPSWSRAGRSFPGSPLRWTALWILAVAAPWLVTLLLGALRPPLDRSWRAYYAAIGRDAVDQRAAAGPGAGLPSPPGVDLRRRHRPDAVADGRLPAKSARVADRVPVRALAVGLGARRLAGHVALGAPLGRALPRLAPPSPGWPAGRRWPTALGLGPGVRRAHRGVDLRAPGRPLAGPVSEASGAPARPRAEGRCAPVRAPALEVLRALRHRRDSLAGAGQRPGGSGTGGGDADLTHQHRPAAPGGHQRPRPGLPPARGDGLPARARLRLDRAAAPVPGSLLQLVRPPRSPGARRRRTSRRWTAATWPACSSPCARPAWASPTSRSSIAARGGPPRPRSPWWGRPPAPGSSRSSAWRARPWRRRSGPPMSRRASMACWRSSRSWSRSSPRRASSTRHSELPRSGRPGRAGSSPSSAAEVEGLETLARRGPARGDDPCLPHAPRRSRPPADGPRS